MRYAPFTVPGISSINSLFVVPFCMAAITLGNYSTSDTLGYNVARVNDAFTKMHYKDA